MGAQGYASDVNDPFHIIFKVSKIIKWLVTNNLLEQLALTETSYLAARLIQSFEKIEARDSRPWTEKYTIVAFSQYGTLVGVTNDRMSDKL